VDDEGFSPPMAGAGSISVYMQSFEVKLRQKVTRVSIEIPLYLVQCGFVYSHRAVSIRNTSIGCQCILLPNVKSEGVKLIITSKSVQKNSRISTTKVDTKVTISFRDSSYRNH